MKYKYEILALLGLIVLLIVYYSYFHNKNMTEGLDNLSELKKEQRLDVDKYFKKL